MEREVKELTKKVAVLYGGMSTEREVSLRTGDAIADALTLKGYNVVKIDVKRDVALKLSDAKPDVAFIGLHGKYGEDGTIQGLLEIMHIPYTGPGVLASALAINKKVSKKIFASQDITTAPFIAFDYTQWHKNKAAIILEVEKLGFPLVVKAALQGSSIGIYFVKSSDELLQAITEALELDKNVVIEKFISGIEVTVAILGNSDPQILPVIEIVSHTGAYDYHSKYTAGASSHIIPARISPLAEKRVQEEALKTYLALDCKGLSRVDAIIDSNDIPYILEVNTSPGMTATSLFPDAAKAAGIDFPELCEKIVNLALEQ